MNTRPLLWPILGAVRFFLALIVACSHLGNYFSHSWLVDSIKILDQHAAVMAFFAISGYSIAASYAKSADGFYRRRVLRIWPLYILSVVFACAVTYGTGSFAGINGMPPTKQVIQNLFFLQGWSTVAIMANLALWSLSIEVSCYVLAPMFAKISQPLLLLVALFSCGLYFFYTYFSDSPRSPIFMIHGRSFALMMWFWLAGFIAFRAGIGTKQTAPAWVCSIGSLLGDISFPLYLFHLPIIGLINRSGIPMSSGMVLLLAISIAAMLDRYFDQPLKRWILREKLTAGHASLGRPVAAAA